MAKWGSGSDRVSYYCDTQGGNSGSPVFSARTGYAFAIHSHGGCSGNKNSKNWGGLLENPGNVAAFNKYGIPYVNRQTTNIFKYEAFQKESSCFDHAGSVTLKQKTLDECKKLCVNSLTCVSIGYSPSTKKCEVNYRSKMTSATCDGDEENWKRKDTLTTQLSDAIIVTTPPPPPPASACTPGTCTCGFESMGTTGCKKWKNVASDNFDWSRKSGKTPSSSTGPEKAKGGAYYMYIETSAPRKSGDKAVLRSDPVIMGASGEVEFYYNMYGSNIASLEVQVIDATGTSHSAWKESGNKGKAWHHAQVSLGSYAGNIEVQFVGLRGSSWKGDIAIDDITLTSGGGSPTTGPPFWTTVPPTTAPPTTAPPGTCVPSDAEKKWRMWPHSWPKSCDEMQKGWQVCTKPNDPNHGIVMKNCPVTCALARGDPCPNQPTTTSPTSPPFWTTVPPTAPPTTVPPTAPPTTMPPTVDLKKKIDVLEKKIAEVLKLVKSLASSGLN